MANESNAQKLEINDIERALGRDVIDRLLLIRQLEEKIAQVTSLQRVNSELREQVKTLTSELRQQTEINKQSKTSSVDIKDIEKVEKVEAVIVDAE